MNFQAKWPGERGLLPVRLLKEYAYCPRYAYFQVFLARSYVTCSMRAALEVEDPLARLDPDSWRVERGVYVASRRLGLHGFVDALLVRGRLVKVVEAKALTRVSSRALRGRLRHVMAQAGAYGMCAEESLGLTLTGVVIVGSNGVVEEKVTPAHRRYVESLARGLWRMVIREEDPGPRPRRECGYCVYGDVCRAVGLRPSSGLGWLARLHASSSSS
ncbi:MAG: CRISPR-associated protein Cas4 [Thermoprotei archaeon]|nr:MAG: CRISPR-associated protein Cas4 [Thermoprotei archaeon]